MDLNLVSIVGRGSNAVDDEGYNKDNEDDGGIGRLGYIENPERSLNGVQIWSRMVHSLFENRHRPRVGDEDEDINEGNGKQRKPPKDEEQTVWQW